MKNRTKAIIGIIVLIVAILLILVLFNVFNDYKGNGLQYRVFNEDGWSKWYSNNQIAGKTSKRITAIEIKIDSNNSHIIYNTSSTSDDFSDNDTYDGNTSGNKKDALYGIKIALTDDLYKNNKIYYRTYNKKDGWLDWTSDYNISGDNEVDIEKIQIKIIDKDDEFKEKQEKSSIGF